MGARNPCPKCGGVSWFEVEGSDLIQRCVCGYLGYVMTKDIDGYKIIRNESERELTLPRRGTKLSRCLGVVASLYPHQVTTKQVSDSMLCETSEVASQMMVLKHKGLVEITEEGRGIPGGSRWKLTLRAVKILKLSRR